MEIIKFDPNMDDIELVTGLIIKGYEESGGNTRFDQDSRFMVKEMIEAGNNFLGHENIYLCKVEKEIAGLFIAYRGKSNSSFKNTLRLLLKLKLNQVFNNLIINSRLFDSEYTPNLDKKDFYISVIVVKDNFRKKGIASFMLENILSVAQDKGCTKVILDVDQNNTAAQALYKKFGFKKSLPPNKSEMPSEVNSMDTLFLALNSLN